jgi:hypothetical protein
MGAREGISVPKAALAKSEQGSAFVSLDCEIFELGFFGVEYLDSGVKRTMSANLIRG